RGERDTLPVLAQCRVELGDSGAGPHPNGHLGRFVLDDAHRRSNLARAGIDGATDLELCTAPDRHHRPALTHLVGKGVKDGQTHTPGGTRWSSPQREPAGSTLPGLAKPSG